MKYLYATIIASLFIISCNNQNIQSSSTSINTNTIMSLINSGQTVEFVDKQISGKLDFSTINNIFTNTPAIAIAEINSPITFVGCTFNDSVIAFSADTNYATITNFNKPVTFIKCTFEKSVNFRQNTFNQNVVFAQCEFLEDVHFEGAVFAGNNSDFKEVTYNKLVKFTNSSFYGKANFMNSQYNNISDFNNCFFNRSASFATSNFVKTANFGNTNFKGSFTANYSIFSEKAYFDNCTFEDYVDFVRVTSKVSFIFTNNIIFNSSNFNKSFFDGSLKFSDNCFYNPQNLFEEFSPSDSCRVELENNKIFTSEEIDILLD